MRHGRTDIRLRRTFAANLKRARVGRGWTQEKLAEACGLSLVFINRVENCVQAISIDSIQRISDTLKMEASDLLSRDGDAV